MLYRPILDGSECRFSFGHTHRMTSVLTITTYTALCFPEKAESRFTQEVEEARTFETSVNIYCTTWRHIPEDSILDNHYHVNLRSERRSLVGTL